jgi:hypothetical protein
MKVMGKEVVSQLLLSRMLIIKIHHVQVGIFQMDKETVFQIKHPKYIVPVDSPLTEKEDVFGFQPLFNGQTLEIHCIHLLLKSQCRQYHFAQQVTIQMDMETVLLHRFQIFALGD